ncbi:VanZ family protein [Micromonospora haikouensis]|uniref:VanZ family protein n=1 Tax=Micromonospora haikouensis TaxID=686309 RepID=UPI0011874B4E|nr:VanZ family protein [Micromonospora haikouensis]
MGEIQVVLQAWIGDRRLLAALLIGVSLALAAGPLIAKACHRSRRWTTLTLVSLAPILAFTALTPPGQPLLLSVSNGMPESFLAQFGDLALIKYQVTTFGGSAEKAANVALYVPLGFASAMAGRRIVITIGAGIMTSFAIELWQALNSRSGEFADVLHNSVGVATGALLAFMLIKRQEPKPVRQETHK